MVYDGAVEAGNKLIANLGLIEMYGTARTAESYQTRLRKDLLPNEAELTVSTGLDWAEGDQIAVLTNTKSFDHTEYFTVANYNDLTGVVSVTQPA